MAGLDPKTMRIGGQDDYFLPLNTNLIIGSSGGRIVAVKSTVPMVLGSEPNKKKYELF